MKAIEDFLELVVVAHITAAAKMLQQELSTVQGCTDLAKALVHHFISISIPIIEQMLVQNSEDGIQDRSPEVEITDSMYSYAVDILTLGLL